MDVGTISSIIFLVCFNVYVFMAIYVYKISSRWKNKVFSFSCILLAIWSLGFALSNQAASIESALIWRRLAAIGWGAFYSVFLHFVILLTAKTEKLKAKWLYLLIYAPAFFMIYVYSLNASIAVGQYDLHFNAAGLTNHSVNNIYDKIFNLYYIGYLVICLILLVRQAKIGSSQDKKSALIIAVTLLLAAVIGSFTDIIQGLYFPGSFPQMAPLIIMVPISAIFLLIRKKEFLKDKHSPTNFQEGTILNEEARETLMNYLSIFLFIGASVFVIASHLSFRDQLDITLLVASAFVILAVLNSFIQMLNLSAEKKNLIASLIMAIASVLLIARFSEYSSVTVWAVPLLLFMFLSVFKQKIILISVFLISGFTVILIWIMKPYQMVKIDSGDHLARIIILGFGLILALHINKIVYSRLNESEYRTKIQKTISEITQNLINNQADDFDNELTHSMELLGKQFCLDYSFFIEISNHKLIYKNEWKRENCPCAVEINEEFDAEGLPWLYRNLAEGKIIKILDHDELPMDVMNEREAYKRFHNCGLILAPVQSKDELLGCIGFAFSKERKMEYDVDGETLEILANIVCQAIEKRKKDQQIINMAFYDQLTSIPNKTMFDEILRRDVNLSSRTGKILGVVFLDLDEFKSVNDTLGHKIGDELIRQVAKRLSFLIRAHDTVARYGGDEFLLILNNMTSVSDLQKKVDLIMDAFIQPFILNELEYFVTCSAGVSMYPIDGEDSETLVKNADIAMYNSKKQGKNIYSFCTSVAKEDILEKIKLTNDLYRALERNEFEVYYQPQLCILNKKIVGFEALLRWNHPERGQLLPGKFIHLAENTRLINPIGKWVMETACTQLKHWNNMGFNSLSMAVNLSLIQLVDSNIVDIVRNIILELEIDPKDLELEITESAATNRSLNIDLILNALKALGVSISIDDFGTEYSSLARLKTLPIDRIKMDMQFVHSIGKSIKDDAIARIIIQLAKNLNLSIIAEGIETEKQFDFLSANACDQVQGFLYYKPMKAEDAEKLLLNQRMCEEELVSY